MITVLLATYNGAQTLKRMLPALVKQTVSEFEVVVVDNGSNDETRKIVQSYHSVLNIRYALYPDRGKNKALNYGIDLINGDLTILTDDDVIPDPDWIEVLSEAASKLIEYDVFGGAISPRWPHSPPQWILDNVPLGTTYALTLKDTLEGPISAGSIWGPNMMIRSSIFALGYRFREDLGPTDGEYVMGSETEFTKRLERNGFKCYFLPKAKVEHVIRPHQMEMAWITGRAFRSGRGNAYQSLKNKHNQVSELFGLPRWRISLLIRDYMKLIYAKICFQKIKAFSARWEIEYNKGWLYEARKRTKHRHQQTVK